jgi:hypothetical protein
MTFSALEAAPALLIYDNVVAFEEALPWLPFSGMPCHVLITTLVDNPTLSWPCLEVESLSHEQSIELVEQVTSGNYAAQPRRPSPTTPTDCPS